ncbi:hypothetical protein IFM89_032416 [Coptis chinensis]|uniref:SWIM-type domain-containing protein n=1 Tax=Coptis chinensis TaxID=261450 RepID=A0A835I554_9MAGN|nr:hypothetical protein IFM89_032416 [Coptis chinensis]
MSSSSKPYVGMEFDSLHQAFLFYNEYAAVIGFSVRKDKTRKSNVDGSYLFRRFCCSKEGFPRNGRDNGNEGFVQIRDGVAVKVELRIPPVPRLSRRAKIEMKRRAEVLQKMRVGCNAKMDVKRSSDGKWIVQKFVEEHNHECVSLGETHLLRSHRGRQVTNGENGGSEGGELDLADELSNRKPSVGMEFESHHKAFLYYNAYARVLGFVVRKDKTRKSNIDGSLLFRRFCCSREGYRRKNGEDDTNDRKHVRGGVVVKVKPRILPVTRVGCNAKMEVKKTSDGKWIVQKFIEEHNHEFDRLGDLNMLRSQKDTQSTQGPPVSVMTDEVETDTIETNRTFVVSRWGQNSSRIVNFYSCDNDIRVCCSCLNLELMGILCRHILKVFSATNIMLVPEAYFKKRWTKRAKWGVVSDDSNKDMQTDHQNPIASRYNELCRLALSISAKGAISLKAYQIAKSNIVNKIRETEKDAEEDTHTSINQLDADCMRISRPPVGIIENCTSSNNLVAEDNHMLSAVSQVGFYDSPRARARGRPPKRITPLVGESQSCKKARNGPDTSDSVTPLHSRRGVPEPHDPCHAGDMGGQETQSHRLLNMSPDICVYACPPGPSGDLNDQYHSSETAAFGEPFAGLSCIQTSEPNFFDLNQDVTVGSSSLQCSQTSHLDLNQVNHVGGPSDSWLPPSSGWFKLNFVGSSKEVCMGSTSRRVAGFGGTISISDGSVIKAFAGSAGEVPAVDSEVLALWNGLKLLSTLPSSPVWIEGESELVIKWLTRDIDPPWRFTPMFFEIQSIMSRLVLGRISHNHREGNSLAHKLANEGLTKDSLTVWDQMPNL